MLFENLLKIYEIGHKLTHLNLGGGFPVNYLLDKSHESQFSDEQKNLFSASLEPLDVLRDAWNIIKETANSNNAAHLLENIELLLEPGRSVISDAGICLTSVRNRKERPIQKSQRVRESEIQIRDKCGKFSKSPNLQIFKSPNDIWLLTDAGFNLLLSMETYKWYYHLISANRADEPHRDEI